MSSMLRSLQRKTRRRTHYDLVLDDPTEAETLEMERAEAALRLARMRHEHGNPELTAALDAAQVRWDAARDGLQAHVSRITFQAIGEHVFDELQSSDDHAPTPRQVAAHEAEAVKAKAADKPPPPPPRFNPDTLIPAVFALCVVPPDGEEALTEAEWAHELRRDGDWQEAEKQAAFDACLTAIFRPRSVQIPKG